MADETTRSLGTERSSVKSTGFAGRCDEISASADPFFRGRGAAGNAPALSSRNEGPATENQRFPYSRNMIPPVLYRKRTRLQTYRSEFSLHDLKF